MPQKTFEFKRIKPKLRPLKLPKKLTARKALERVLRLVSVGSKRFLTNKVDRSVTGQIARQQCAGPLQLPLLDVAVVTQSLLGLIGVAISIGEQPIKGLINPSAMARMSVVEALTNIMWAKVTSLSDISCSANWMLAAKQPGVGANLYDAAVAMRDIMLELGIKADGGKDSLSMAARDGKEIVKAPDTLVISAYCTVSDITKIITPDIKRPGSSRLLFIDLAKGKRRLGGSALAHVYGQIGNDCPDIENPEDLKYLFMAIQQMIDEGLLLSGHDVSDGGLIVALLEMAFAGNCGIEAEILTSYGVLEELFAEEVGVLIEVMPKDNERVKRILADHAISEYSYKIASTTKEKRITIRNIIDKSVYLNEDMRVLRGIWEETSHQLQIEQKNLCAEEEKKNIFDRSGMRFRIKSENSPTAPEIMARKKKPRVAIIREEGSNGDREMTSAFHYAGFECWDVTMTDLLAGRITLKRFRGIVFVGGFSYADVLDSAKGWAGVIRFNKKLRKMFDEFYNRSDTFSLGVCNGCQLMALLDWVPWRGIPDTIQPRFIKNKSGMFESRFSAVHILKSPAIMLRRMEGSTLGVWVAHGEGRMHFHDPKILTDVLKQSLAPIRFVDDDNTITERYPFNPNGSRNGITALCSPDGRHLAMMPHPERVFLNWQWGYLPPEMNSKKVSPWLQMFQNARIWCEQTKK